VTLTSNDPEEKLALSFSLAQSAKLFVFEVRGLGLGIGVSVCLCVCWHKQHQATNTNPLPPLTYTCTTPQDRVDGTITSTKHIPLHLAEHGKINVSRKEISKLTGQCVLVYT
jgi:hypothetical protein